MIEPRKLRHFRESGPRPSSKEHFREDAWLPPILDRSGYTGPEQEEVVLNRLQEKADKLIASYRKPEVDPDRLAQMRAVVERARKELVEGSREP